MTYTQSKARTKAVPHPHYSPRDTAECYADPDGYLCERCAEGQLEFGETLPGWEDEQTHDDDLRIARIDLSECDPDLYGRSIECCRECDRVLIADTGSMIIKQAYLYTQTDHDEWQICTDTDSQYAGFVQWHHTDPCGIMWRVQIDPREPDSATFHRALPIAGCWQYDALDGEPALSTVLIGEQANRLEAFDSLRVAMTDVTLKNQPPLF